MIANPSDVSSVQIKLMFLINAQKIGGLDVFLDLKTGVFEGLLGT